MARGVRRLAKSVSFPYGRAKIDKRGGRALKSPNRITASGRGERRN